MAILRPSHSVAIAVLAAIVISQCRSGPYPSLSPAEREPFERCRSSIRPVVCRDPNPRSDDLVCAHREGDAADEYAMLAPGRRGAWLVGHGCPPAVAEYEEPAPTSGSEAPAPATRTDAASSAAVAAAAADHDCPAPEIVVQSEHFEGGRSAFWLYVCGTQRFYRWDEGAGGFVDQTPASSAAGSP